MCEWHMLMIYSSWAYSGKCFATILCAGDETAPRLIGFIFLLGTGRRNKLCIRGACKHEQARLTAAAYSCLPVQIYRFLAQCKDYQRELCGPARALSRFIDLLLFQTQNVHSSSKQGILSLWVPSMERRGSVLSQADCCGQSQAEAQAGALHLEEEERRKSSKGI